jgi:Protein of unknown function (DUF3631)
VNPFQPGTAEHDAWARQSLAEGALLLAALHAALGKYVVFPSPEAHDAVALWIVATHGQTAWEHAPRLVLTSPEKRCGKSRCQDIVVETCHRPLITVNATVAAVVRSLGDDPPTLAVDEADTIFGTKRQADSNEDLRGILNAGHQRNRPMIRWDITTRSLETLSTFAMACLAAIGDLPDTIMDRAVVVRMRRRAPNEQVAPYRTRRDSPPLNDLRDRIADWVASVGVELVDAVPAMPVEDRAADTWEPLVAIADAAGGDWPTRARAAAVVLVAEAVAADTEMSAKIRLLADIRDIFHEFTVSFLPSQELVNRLCKIEDAPWAQEQLTMRGLADRLRPFGVRPGHNAAKTARGYRVEDFTESFARYLRPKVSEPSDTGSDQQEQPDGFGAPDTSNRPGDTNRPGESAGRQGSRTVRTGSDAPTAETVPCRVCGKPLQPYYVKIGRDRHPACLPF